MAAILSLQDAYGVASDQVSSYPFQVSCFSLRLHLRLQFLHWRIFALMERLRRTPFDMVLVDPQYGHLCGRPLGIFITSMHG